MVVWLLTLQCRKNRTCWGGGGGGVELGSLEGKLPQLDGERLLTPACRKNRTHGHERCTLASISTMTKRLLTPACRKNRTHVHERCTLASISKMTKRRLQIRSRMKITGMNRSFISMFCTVEARFGERDVPLFFICLHVCVCVCVCSCVCGYNC